jgi:riboflavin kinase/FMN adenylyltransferase
MPTRSSTSSRSDRGWAQGSEPRGCVLTAPAGSPGGEHPDDEPAGGTPLPGDALPWTDLCDMPPDRGPCVVTIGVFDGVHRGHAELIGRAVAVGRTRREPTVLVTFHPHPARLIGPPRDTATLTSLRRRASLARELGVDRVVALPFTRAVAHLPPETFVEEVLLHQLCATTVVVGRDFRFGHRAAGTTGTLEELGLRLGFAAHAVDLVDLTAGRCSSTHIRGLIRAGDIAAAAAALGRPHRIEGRLVLRGGEHAAGFRCPPDTAVPGPGRYRAMALRPGSPPPGDAVGVTVTAGDECAVSVSGPIPLLRQLAGSALSLDFLP